MFERVLIANRGEVVARIARTLRRLGCSPAALRARDDTAITHVRCCDVAVEVDSYLDVEAVVAAAQRAGAQAIHPGYGFLSERAELAIACEAAGLVWVGPPAGAIALMGDKSGAREAARAAGVPVLPGAEAGTPEQVAQFAGEHGLPVLVKAAAGGGGKGMRLLSSLDGIEEALAAARREAAAAFGDDALLVERMIAPARHLELQLLADAHGTVLDLGERECSLQRRHQKVVEEAPSPTVDAALRAELAREGVALARACGYVGAGTVEFVAHAQDPASHYFLEMNTRLQVEHAVTEAVRGVDLVEWQLRIAAGERLADADAFAHVRGHAVEARVYAEDPAAGFLPAAGSVRALRLPRGAGIRVESGVAAGETVGTRYDPLLAKVIAHGSTRAEALARLRGALRETAVLGVRTNVGFLCELLGDPHVLAGELDTGLVERTPVGATAPVPAARAALVALVAQALERRRRDPGREDPFARLGGWRVAGAPAAVPQQLRVDGSLEVEVALASLPAGVGGAPGEGFLDGRPVSLALLGDEPCGGGRLLHVAIDGIASRWVAVRDGERWWVGADGHSWLIAPRARERDGELDGHGDVRAPMPGAVVAVHTQAGAEVLRGEVLLVMESMKMELQITAPRDGRVEALHVSAGDQVALDAVLASLEPGREERS
jgi:acetyl-CoA/propionyl-CoA carboxylase biotin carboxyl carrier protein